MRKNTHFDLIRDNALLMSLAAVILLAHMFGDTAVNLFRYERAGILRGEWWRWLTAHLVHLSFAHLALNAAGLGICGLLVGNGLTGLRGAAILCGAVAACGLGLWLLNPELQWYVGLSGVLHGLLLGGALGLPSTQRRWQWVVGALVTAKLLSEQLLGPALSTAQLIGHAVIVDAHLYGAAGGVLGWFLHRQITAWRRR